MTILALWLPILLSAVLVFIVSSILHMVLPLHRHDFAKLPQEDDLRADIRSRQVPPGNYVIPCPDSPSEMRTPEFRQKYEEGPVGFLYVLPSGPPAMGRALVQWFVYSIVIGIFVAYLTSRTVEAGASYWAVFRVAGATGFMCYALGSPIESIWMGRRWSTTFKNLFDGLIYSLMVAGSFAGFWPGAS
jgi:hypothetical protein